MTTLPLPTETETAETEPGGFTFDLNGNPIHGHRILRAASDLCGVSLNDMASDGRMPRQVAARRVVTVMCRHFTTMSYPQIAALIGKPNHSTVITTIQAARRRDALDLAEYTDLAGEGVTVRGLCNQMCEHFGIPPIEGSL